MNRKAVLLIAGLLLLVAASLIFQSLSKPRFFAQGRMVLIFEADYPTNEPYSTSFSGYVAKIYANQPAIIDNLLNDSNRMAFLIQKSSAQNADVQLEEHFWPRGPSPYIVRFSGNEQAAVLRMATNACVMLVEFISINRPVNPQFTNRAFFTAEFIEAGIWKPAPLWRQMLDEIESIYYR